MLDPSHPLSELLRQDKRYDFHAYVFVFDALRYAHEKLSMGESQSSDSVDLDDDDEDREAERHVTGQQLCEAIRQYALEEFGLLAKNVLNHWGVASTGDFGELVFNLIEIGQMRKTSNDRREDFDDVFDFDVGLCDAFEICVPDSSEEKRS